MAKEINHNKDIYYYHHRQKGVFIITGNEISLLKPFFMVFELFNDIIIWDPCAVDEYCIMKRYREMILMMIFFCNPFDKSTT